MDGKMKIIITGHTSPMGNAVYDYYKQKHEVLGVSKKMDSLLFKMLSEVVEKAIFTSYFQKTIF